MRATEIVGKTVKEIHQTRFFDYGKDHVVYRLDWIRFDDGTILHLMADDDGIDNYTTGFTIKRTPR